MASIPLLTDEQIQGLRERGFFHLGRVFEDAELEEIRTEYDRLLVAQGGRVLDEPVRERRLDLAKLLSTAS